MKINFVVTLTSSVMDRLKLTTNRLVVGNDQEVGGTDELWDYLNEQDIQYDDVLLIVPENETSDDRIVADAVRLLKSRGMDVILGLDQDISGVDVVLVASVMYGNLVEYQISDAGPGDRSNSYDTYTYAQAKKIFDDCLNRGYFKPYSAEELAESYKSIPAANLDPVE